MIHIIDGNNLAGKLDIIHVLNFDSEIIEIIKDYSVRKNKKIVLVFDSLDPMGDKYEEENLTIIYTPRDNFYNGADDKIIEELEGFLKNEKNEYTVITDDLELIDRVDKVAEDFDVEIFINKASDFVLELAVEEGDLNDDSDRLTEGQEDEINKELLNVWS